ncbi:MAG: hypothetical protein ACP5XB_28415 [Isosphaeraceae bacterium]
MLVRKASSIRRRQSVGPWLHGVALRVALEARQRARGFSLETCFASSALGWRLPRKVPLLIIEKTVQLVLKWHTVCTSVVGIGSPTIPALAQGVITTMFWNSVKLATIPALVATCVVGSVVLGQQGQAPVTGPGGPGRAASRAEAKKVAWNDPAWRARLTVHVRELLTRQYDLGLPNDSSLEQFLKAIRKVTIDSDANSPESFHGIPIYVNPDGLKYVGMTLQSQVNVDPGKRILAETLEKTLKSVKLWYEIDDGFLKIDAREGIIESRLKRVEDKLDRLIKAVEAQAKRR